MRASVPARRGRCNKSHELLGINRAKKKRHPPSIDARAPFSTTIAFAAWLGYREFDLEQQVDEPEQDRVTRITDIGQHQVRENPDQIVKNRHVRFLLIQ
jgi:hypothetical protein